MPRFSPFLDFDAEIPIESINTIALPSMLWLFHVSFLMLLHGSVLYRHRNSDPRKNVNATAIIVKKTPRNSNNRK